MRSVCFNWLLNFFGNWNCIYFRNVWLAWPLQQGGRLMQKQNVNLISYSYIDVFWTTYHYLHDTCTRILITFTSALALVPSSQEPDPRGIGLALEFSSLCHSGGLFPGRYGHVGLGTSPTGVCFVMFTDILIELRYLHSINIIQHIWPLISYLTCSHFHALRTKPTFHQEGSHERTDAHIYRDVSLGMDSSHNDMPWKLFDMGCETLPFSFVMTNSFRAAIFARPGLT